MKPEALKKAFGDEYPAAVSRDGIRMPLRRERRFSRSYYSAEHKTGSEISRLMDGSASITASELECEWHTWSDEDRLDFCQSCCWLQEQPDFSDMLRFIMQHSGPDEWSGIAMSAASKLPRDEAFDMLVRVLRTVEIGQTSNIGQAIAITKHPAAERTLRDHLETIWAHSAVWEDAEFINWIAFDATTCITHLIELGARPRDFEAHVRRLIAHVCAHNRDACRNRLRKHYEWLT